MKRADGDRPRAKRSLGQNFLSDPTYVARIVEAASLSPADIVIEIGPGRGALTQRLVASGAKVVAIELDRDLIEPLRSAFSANKNFEVIEQDALDVDLKEILSGEFDGGQTSRAKLVANLPYYISTAILQRLADQRGLLSELILMFQREVVDRITAKPGNSERGFLTVLAQSAFEIEKLFDVPPNAFRPAPKVFSSVVRLIPKPPSDLDDGRFRKLASVGFAQKRKNIANNLKSAYPNWAEALGEARIDPKRRAEDLSLDEWTRLFHAVAKG